MATSRRRRSAGTRSRSGSTPPRKRRTVKKSTSKPKTKQTIKKKPVSKPVKKKRAVRQKRPAVNWKDRLQKLAITLFCIADFVLIYFFIRHCAAGSPEPPPPPDPTPVVEETERVLQIEVLNGCGVSGIAARFTDFLRDAGFDVVKTDNYQENGRNKFNMASTVVVDRRGNKENALKIARALRLPRVKVLSEPHENYLIDASVILGEDYSSIEIWNILEREYE